MPSNNKPSAGNTESPYQSGKAFEYVVHENSFTIPEPRLKEVFGTVYDKTLQANPVPRATWRDILTGAFLSDALAFLYEGSNSSWAIWPTLWIYVIAGILLFVLSVILWIKHVKSWLDARNNQTARSRVVEEAFDSIVSICSTKEPHK